WKAPRLEVAQQFEFCETCRPIAALRAPGQRKTRIPGVRPARVSRASPKLSSEKARRRRRRGREATTARDDNGERRSSRRRQATATNDTANAAHACERSARTTNRPAITHRRKARTVLLRIRRRLCREDRPIPHLVPARWQSRRVRLHVHVQWLLPSHQDACLRR